jgi:O-antigen/teichoic acid export membrane protein
LSLLKNATSLLVTSAIVAPVGLLSSVVLARFLPAQELASYSVALSLAMVSVLLVQFGWPSATIYRIRAAGAAPAVVARAGMGATLGSSLVAVLVIWAFEAEIRRLVLRDAPALLLRLAMLLVPLQLFGLWFVSLARALDRFDIANQYRLMVSLGLLVSLLSILPTIRADARTALLCTVFAHAVASIATGARVLVRTRISRSLPKGELGRGLRYGAKSYVQAMAVSIHEQIDIFMLSHLLPQSTGIAYYYIAVSVVNRLKLVPDAIAAALFPQAAALPPGEAAGMTAKAARHSLAAAGLCVVLVAAVSPFAIPLIWGDAYGASVLPTLLLLPGMLMLTISLLLARFFMATARQQINIWAQLISIAGNVALNAALIPRMGIVGAALASLASYSLQALLILLAFRHASRIPLADILRLRGDEIRALGRRALRQLNGLYRRRVR